MPELFYKPEDWVARQTNTVSLMDLTVKIVKKSTSVFKTVSKELLKIATVKKKLNCKAILGRRAKL